jgi:hypothetical protein
MWAPLLSLPLHRLSRILQLRLELPHLRPLLDQSPVAGLRLLHAERERIRLRVKPSRWCILGMPAKQRTPGPGTPWRAPEAVASRINRCLA